MANFRGIIHLAVGVDSRIAKLAGSAISNYVIAGIRLRMNL